MQNLGDILARVKLQRQSKSESQPSKPVGNGKPICPRCNGHGFVSYKAKFGDPAFGQIFPCRMCTKRTTYTFEAFQEVPGSEVALEKAMRFARGEGKPWLLLLGDVGCGKTHLAHAGCDVLHWTQPLLNVRMGFVPDILAHIRGAYGEQNSGVAEKWMDSWRTCDVAVFDDLGAQKATDWATETLLRMLNARYEAKKRTLITCNMTAQGLQNSVGERLLSRLRDVHLCEEVFMTSGDFRKG